MGVVMEGGKEGRGDVISRYQEEKVERGEEEEEEEEVYVVLEEEDEGLFAIFIGIDMGLPKGWRRD